MEPTTVPCTTDHNTSMSDSTSICVLLTRDLLFSSRVRSAAETSGIRLTMAEDLSQLAQALRDGGDALVLIDLAQPGLDVENVVAAVRQLAPPPGAIVAFGPHVQEDLLRRAREAGCDEVLTRGEFNKRMAAVLGKYAAPQ